MKDKFAFILLALMFISLSLQAKERPRIEKAPLPSQMLTARKVFISKGIGATAFTVKGGFELAFDAFYSDMKSWGRYEITDKPEDADLIMQVSYSAKNGGTEVSSATNTYTNQTTVYSQQILDLNLSLVISDPHTKTELWSTSVAPGTARFKKNQEKEMIKAGQKLVAMMEERVPTANPTPTPPS